jgi:two-component system chemotaxis response regulator CheB
MDDDATTAIEIRIAAADNALEAGVMQLGPPTPYTCPDCHGVLLAVNDGEALRFRCHTGHAFSPGSLLAAVSATTEDQLWSTLRTLDENILLLNQL